MSLRNDSSRDFWCFLLLSNFINFCWDLCNNMTYFYQHYFGKKNLEKSGFFSGSFSTYSYTQKLCYVSFTIYSRVQNKRSPMFINFSTFFQGQCILNFGIFFMCYEQFASLIVCSSLLQFYLFFPNFPWTTFISCLTSILVFRVFRGFLLNENLQMK